jgi:hypothetical protein
MVDYFCREYRALRRIDPLYLIRANWQVDNQVLPIVTGLDHI